MSKFLVEIVEIDQVVKHPDADSLEIISIKNMGYQVISKMGNYKSGDLAIYFPIDSVIPDDLVEVFGIRAYYNGKIRAAKLRGIFSEGLLIPIDIIKAILSSKGRLVSTPDEKEYYLNSDNTAYELSIGTDLSHSLGITKYEYPLPTQMGGIAEMPVGQYKFPSPENYKRYSHLLEKGEYIFLTEKVHGSHLLYVLDEEGIPHIGSHNYFWKIDAEENTNNIYVRAYKENPNLAKVPKGYCLYGEVYGSGVQDLKYGLKNGQIRIAVFAIAYKRKILNMNEVSDLCRQWELPMVPVLYEGPYSDEIVQSFNNADSYLCPGQIQEGVVIVPKEERSSLEIGRVCLKSISDRYSLRKEGTELH
ncbi:RNA ligase [Calothrix sp. FACHB-1219]|uniref:RNA ligase family protein n=1 Tax=unclassified Calothrix TaxID=2619626 RepID=UPI0016895CF7|nr:MULTISPECIES: RNA ligase family protein [unclassified Calothrix]MBD2201810.1 RNA ligase [Calothrix sp. FACHB-168]MBD2217496.1 RNA ligase [Calothrix sp. FACHB-1219]